VKLTVTEAASLLGSSEERVFNWIEDSELPAQKLRGQYRVNRTDLLEWATERNITVSPRAFRQERGAPTLADALRAGGVHHKIAGSDIPTILRNIVGLLPLDDPADRETLLQILLARNALGVTPVGEGIAIPHARTPIVLAPTDAVLALSFLTNPIDLHAPDGKPVDTFFLLICPTIHVHLAMLAKLAYGLQDDAFRAAVRAHASGDEIARIATVLEEAF
jgi:PTS system nitrogen regulatory IIA component